MATSRDRGPAEQQGDGQPENLDELRDPAGGSALAGEGEDAPARPGGASASPRDGGAAPAPERESESRGRSQADGAETPESD